VVTFNYDGLARTVEPHVYGVNTAGHEALSAYQTGGFSRSSDRPGWRMFLLSGIRDLVVEDAKFEVTRPGYNPHDSGMSRIFAQA
jgi:hypothetical protein